MEWFEAVDIIRPHVVRISTPQVTGTGFLISNSENTDVCGVATAAHVIDHAHYWEEPIRIEHADSEETVLVRHADRAVFIDASRDTAAILFRRQDISFPNDLLPMIEKGDYLRVANDIGWLGFPAVSQSDLCFFNGKISAWRQAESAYLVDGVAINGVSGGPAFSCWAGKVEIIGVVSAYVPNRATGEALPGLAVVRDVTQFHDLAPTFASLDEAKSEESPPDESPPRPNEPGTEPARSRRAT